MENNKIRATFNRSTMQLISLVDKATGKEMVDIPSANFRLIHENLVHGMTAWRVGDVMSVQNLNQTQDVIVSDVDLSSIKKVVKYALNFGQRSRLEVAIILNDNSSILDFDISVDFHEVCGKENIPQLNFSVPVGYAIANYRYDVPFGTIDRKQIKHDVPANSYAVAVPKDGEDAPSIMVVTDTKYGFRGADNQIAVTLIRATCDPDPYPEYGKHTIRIGVGVVDNANNCALDKQASQYVHPLAVCTTRAGKGNLPLTGQLLKVEGDVCVNSVKTAEDVDGLIVRLADISGKGGKFKLTFAKTVKCAKETDINENVIADVDIDGNNILADIDAYAIKTLLICF